VFGSFGRFRRVAVLGALDRVVGHLAFDDARVGAQAAGWEDLEEEFLRGLAVGVTECRGGKSPRVRRLFGGRRVGSG
jgi:hypothetical protein